jgi:serine protease
MSQAAARVAPGTSEPVTSAPYVPGQLLVGYRSTAAARAADRGAIEHAIAGAPTPDTRVLATAPGETASAAIARLRGQPGIAYAVPNYIAHAAGAFIPNDPGKDHRRGGWQRLQWNFLAGTGIDAPDAWANLIAARHPGGRGATVAVLDTGVAYRDWHQFKKMPDFHGTRFEAPYDFVAHSRYALDREGHGTFVAALVAESTNNGFGLTGVAYGATIMPIRVLDASGNGDSATISRGIRSAADRGVTDPA